jgi:hypothetical protein
MLALESGFPFVKLLSPKDFVTYNDVARCQLINSTFLDAHKSPLSVIVIDDIERFLSTREHLRLFFTLQTRTSSLAADCALFAFVRLLACGTPILERDPTSAAGSHPQGAGERGTAHVRPRKAGSVTNVSRIIPCTPEQEAAHPGHHQQARCA